MGQFLPEIKDIFGEIRKYKVKLEEKVNPEQIDYNSDNPIKYRPKVKYSTD